MLQVICDCLLPVHVVDFADSEFICMYLVRFESLASEFLTKHIKETQRIQIRPTPNRKVHQFCEPVCGDGRYFAFGGESEYGDLLEQQLLEVVLYLDIDILEVPNVHLERVS